MKIYVVTGEDGEYSDWTTWIVKAFTDETKAQEFALACDAFAKKASSAMAERRKSNPYPLYTSWHSEANKAYSKNSHDFQSELIKSSPDPQMPINCYGGYDVKEVELD